MEARDLMDGVADIVVAVRFHWKCCGKKTMEGTAFGIPKQRSWRCWKLEGNWGFHIKDHLKSLKQTLDFSDIWSGLVCQAPVVKTHGSVMPKTVYSTIRQIRTM